MRTISDGVAQRCVPNGLSGVRVALSSAFSVSGSRAISASPPAAAAEPNRRGELLAIEGRALEAGRRAGRGRPRRRSRAARPTDAPRPRARASARRSRTALVVDRLLGLARHQEAERVLAAPRRGARAGRRCARAAGSPSRWRPGSRGRASPPRSASRRSSSAACPRPRRPRRGTRARAATCGPLTPRASASSRIRSARGSSGRWTGWPKPGALPPAAWISRAISSATAAGVAAGDDLRLRLLEQPRARLGRAEDDRAAAEDPRRDGALQRSGVGGERHARGDVGRHHPVLGDRDQEQIEEEALLVGRLARR